MNTEKMLEIIDDYLDYVIAIGENPSEDQMCKVKDKYTIMKGKVAELCNNQRTLTIESAVAPYPVNTAVKKYQRDKAGNCFACSGWGCWQCCSSEQEIRARQGIYG